MNPLTLDFIRRWKWLLLIQFVATTVAWVFHAHVPQARLHLEVLVPVAMSWDLVRGLVRVELGLPQRRESIAAGLWLSVLAVGAGTHLVGMVLGGAGLAPLLGQAVNYGALSLHAILAVVLIGAVQFVLTGLPSAPPRTLAGQVKGTVFAALWGFPMFVPVWLAFFAPAGWEAVTAGQAGIMVLFGVMAVASWFTTRGMLMERAMSKQEAAPPGPAVNPRLLLATSGGWRLRLVQEGRWLLPVLGMVLVPALFMISINDFNGSGSSNPNQPWEYQYRTMGMLCVILVFPLVRTAVGSLRALRGLPMSLSQCAMLVALRPFAGGLVVFLGYTALNGVLGGGTDMAGWALLAFLPLWSLMSLLQALILRFPHLLVAFGLMVVGSVLSALMPEVIKLSLPVFWLPTAAVVMLAASLGLHVRWLGTGSRIYRINTKSQRNTKSQG